MSDSNPIDQVVIASLTKQRDQLTEEAAQLRAALDVNNFTAHMLSLFVDHADVGIVASQLKAAHEAYREATGEDSFDIQIRERIEARKKREAQQ
jgi:hypothetical protein